MQTVAIVVAAGRGVRAAGTSGSAIPKQYRSLGGKPLLSHALEAFAHHPRVDKIVTVIHPDDRERTPTSGADPVLNPGCMSRTGGQELVSRDVV